MLSYQSEAEKNFYEGIKITTSFEFNEFEEEEIDQSLSSTNLPFSINRDSRLNGLLSNFLLDLNKEIKQQASVKGKMSLLNSYLENANKRRETRLKEFKSYPSGKAKYITNQNLGFMNKLIDWLTKQEKLNNEESLNSTLNDKQINKILDLVSLSQIFNKGNNAFEICKELMDELDLTINGIPNPDLKKGRAGTLIGMINAIIITPGMLSIEKPKGNELLKYFNSYLNTSYKTFDNRSKDFEINFPIARDFIKTKLKK